MEEKRIICGIYKITSPSGRVYIGQAVNIKKRLARYKALDCQEQTKLHRSFVKYGFDAHIFEVIEECVFDDLNCRERHWQDYYDVLNGGLNLTLIDCGEVKKEVSDETREKLRQLGYKRVQTDETKEKCRLTSLGRFQSEESREKNRQKHLGKKLSPESIAKRSLKQSKLLLNTQTGIFYLGFKEAADSIPMNVKTLRHKLAGFSKNDTPFIYV